jgi:hypothetical protein
MSSQPEVVVSGRNRRWLIGIAVVLLLFAAYLFGKGSEATKKTQFIPGVGPIDPATGKPLNAMAMGKTVASSDEMQAGGAYAPQSAAEEAPRNMGQTGLEGKPLSSARVKTMLIRTGSMRLRVDKVSTAYEEVRQIVRAADGYISSSSFSSEQGPATATITVRLPAEGLDSVVDQVAELGTVLQRELGAQEVTEEYVDLASRKRNLEREEVRLLELLQRAGKISDLLEVEQTLARVRGEVETISGRMRYLENRVELSTLTIFLEGPQPKPTSGGPVWTAKDIWRQAARSLLNTGRGLATIIIWLGVYAIVWVPILLVLLWMLRKAFPKEK